MKLKTDIENIVRDNPKVSFFKISDIIQEQHKANQELNQDFKKDIISPSKDDGIVEPKFSNIISKQLIGDTIRVLENEKLIVAVNNSYYHTDLFDNEIGYTSWGINGNSWVTPHDVTNDYGLNFDTNNNNINIINKKDADLKTQFIYKIIPLDIEGNAVLSNNTNLENIPEIVKYNALLTKKLKTKNHNLIASMNDNGKLLVLNNNANQEIKIDSISNIKNPTELILNDIVSINVSTDELNNKTLNIIEKIGNIKDKGIEPTIIKKLSDINDYFKTYNFNFNEDNHSELIYKDLQHIPFATIDSIYTKDIDDAIYATKTNEGFKLFVAIADVSSYISKHDDLDLIAKESTTTFYLPLDTVHMLPKELSQDKCSLNPGEIKKTMVSEIDLNNNGEIIKYDFYPAHILSQARLTYTDVDLLLSGKNAIESKFVINKSTIDSSNITKKHDAYLNPILNSLNTLKDIVATLPIKEQLFQPQPEMQIGVDGKIEYLYYENQNTISQKIVENSMMMANKVAATLIHDKYPQFGLFRNQLKPIDGDGTKLKAAYYHNENEGHFGLDTDFYTHFTSPIRRYCDLINHRIIKDISIGDIRTYDVDELLNISQQINIQGYKAKQINIKIKNIFINEYINKLLNNNTFDSNFNISEIKENGFVFINKQLIELFVPTFKVDYMILKEIKNNFKNNLDDYVAQKEFLCNKYNININIKPFHFAQQKRELDIKYINKPKPTFSM